MQTIVIDATHPNALDLCDVLAETFCAANPQQHLIKRIIVHTSHDDSTDWPDFSWLKVTNESLTQSVLNQAGADVFLSLNYHHLEHPVSVVLLSDNEAARFGEHSASGSLLQRLKDKVNTVGNHLEDASALISMSSFGAAQINAISTPQHHVAVGVEPRFFRAAQPQQLIDDTDIDNPFM